MKACVLHASETHFNSITNRAMDADMRVRNKDEGTRTESEFCAYSVPDGLLVFVFAVVCDMWASSGSWPQQR